MATTSLFSKLISPRYPPAAAAVERGRVTVLQLERARNQYSIKRAATVTFPDDLVKPDFSAELNVSNLNELSAALAEAVSSAGMGRQKKWSVALPEGSTRTVIVTLEATPASRAELEQVLTWKIERSFGINIDELQIARERIKPDFQGHARYLITGIRKSVLAEFETVFESLGWRAGLLVPRSVAEGRWFTIRPRGGDSLLISSHSEGFTAAIYRGDEPLLLRSVPCDEADRHDELFRFLLFYRDRLVASEDGAAPKLNNLLLAGEGFTADLVADVIAETLEDAIPVVTASDLGLAIPSPEFSFGDMAAPAGLATLAW